jgi:hypothetical protein
MHPAALEADARSGNWPSASLIYVLDALGTSLEITYTEEPHDFTPHV